jgi:hypothetical protein
LSFDIKQQLQKNLIALISVIIAITALSYNSWRNELSEDNRNVRAAGFEIMREAAQLQYFIDVTTYSDSAMDEEVIQGWVSVNLMVSLAELMSPEVLAKAQGLRKTWASNWSQLANDKAANVTVTEAVNQLVDEVRQHLRSLK